MYTAEGRRPGKFEGNPSQWKAEVLHAKAGDSSWLAGEFGEAEYEGWFGLIIGKRTAWIISEDNYGFFSIVSEGKPADIESEFVIMETEYGDECALINIDPTGMNPL
jgi:hypothetical protein